MMTLWKSLASKACPAASMSERIRSLGVSSVTKYWIFAVVGLLAVIAIGVNFGALKLSQEGLTLFGQILGTLLMMSAVLERALDVLLSIPRAEDSEKLRAAVDEQQRIVDEAQKQNTPVPQDMINALEKAKAVRAEFRAKTMRLAMVGGLVVGVVVSAIGFRVLQTLIDTTSLDELGRLQRSAFDFVDIVLTGAVLAGGSDGIHKLIEVYRRFTEKGSS